MVRKSELSTRRMATGDLYDVISFSRHFSRKDNIRPLYLQQYQVMIGRWRGVGYCGDEFHSTAADLCPVPLIKVGSVLKFGQFHAQLHPRSFTSNSREERESGFDGVTGRHEFRNKFLCRTQAMLLHCVGRSRRKKKKPGLPLKESWITSSTHGLHTSLFWEVSIRPIGIKHLVERYIKGA